jgi:ribonuclease-3
VLARFFNNLFPPFNKGKQYKSVLGFYPGDVSLYETALRHRSASLGYGKNRLNNERLEFLGDAILDAVISDYLYIAHPDWDEGQLTRIRSNMVKRKSMNQAAVKLGIDKLLIINEDTCTQSKSIYGNALEAVIGAIFIDKGYNFCKRFLIRKYIPCFSSQLTESHNYDHKSQLYHLVQEKKWSIRFDTFEHIEENEHIPHFEANLVVNNHFIAEGKGWSKKDAEQKASQLALEKLSV